ncbi:antitoxin [Amnibacterium endophyticum]|uniref:Antitoxin n=1 Tax=Amnibacterium endophyticum TaxID=2109337 RepID=A0ABW4LF68_9MICO
MAGLFDKAKDALNSDKGESTSDSVLDKAARFADEKTGGKHTDKIEQARDAADDRVGNEGSQQGRTTDPTTSRDRM